jgi:hypothetical protein
LVGLLTGHSPLRKHLKIIDLTQTDSCRFCEEDVESAIQFWLDCQALSQRRPSFLGRIFLDPQEFKELGVSQLLGFAKGRKLWN